MVFIIAEAGSNWRMGTHERDFAMAKTLIDVAVDARADAVKFQTFRAETTYVANAGEAEYLTDSGVKGTMMDLFHDLSMPYEMIEKLAEYCKGQKISFMTSAFSEADFKAVDPFVEVHKIASYEISHLRLLALAGRSKKPLILSTGACQEEDIQWAVDTFRANGGKDLTLMQCTVAYPTPVDAVQLKGMVWLHEKFGVPVGLSDHSRNPLYAPLGAVALGASVIEKHYTLDNRLPGPDHSFAITPCELKHMVEGIRNMERMLGSYEKSIQREEKPQYEFMRRGLQALCEIKKGDVFKEDVNYAILRPGNQRLGIHPKHLLMLEGKKASRTIPSGDGIQIGDWA